MRTCDHVHTETLMPMKILSNASVRCFLHNTHKIASFKAGVCASGFLKFLCWYIHMCVCICICMPPGYGTPQLQSTYLSTSFHTLGPMSGELYN